MANKVEIRVTVNGDAVSAELAAIEGETRASAGRQKSAWDKLSSGIGNAFKGASGLAAGALGVGLSGPLAAAGAAVAGFAALAAPTLDKVDKALTTTGKAGQKAWAALDPAQRGIANNIKALEGQFNKAATAFEPVVASVTGLAAKVGGDLIPAISKLAPAGAKVIDAFLRPLDALLSSPMFGKFIDQMSQLAVQVAPVLGQSLAKLLVVFMQMFEQAGPAAVQIINELIPALVDMVSGLVPVVAAVTKVVAAVIHWLSVNHLLIPALIAVGVAIAFASGGLSLIIPAIALAVGGLVHLWQTSQTFRNVVTDAFSAVGQAVLTWAELFLDEMHIVTNIWLTAVGVIVNGAAQAFGWVPGVGGKLKEAAAGFNTFKNDVSNVFNAAHTKIEGWKTDLANMPKVVRLEGNINDLTAKLNNAKHQLADPNLTATRKSEIRAGIAQLQAALAEARRELDAINGKTSTTYVNTVYVSTHAAEKASGGITGAAGGGPRGNLTLVGEHGRELVSLPPGAMVHSNPDTERMLGQGSGGGVLRIVFEGAGDDLTRAFAQALRQHARFYYGGSAQQAYGYGSG